MTTKVEGTVSPLPGRILVKGLEFGEKVSRGGVIIIDDDAQNRGIHPRWAQVWKIGTGIDTVVPGEWVLIAHGRWSRTIIVQEDQEEIKMNMIDPEAILLVSDQPTTDAYVKITKDNYR